MRTARSALSRRLQVIQGSCGVSHLCNEAKGDRRSSFEALSRFIGSLWTSRRGCRNPSWLVPIAMWCLVVLTCGRGKVAGRPLPSMGGFAELAHDFEV